MGTRTAERSADYERSSPVEPGRLDRVRAPTDRDTKADRLAATRRELDRHFEAYRGEQHAPPQGTVIARLWREGRLEVRHCKAAGRLYDDLVAAFSEAPEISVPVDESGRPISHWRSVADSIQARKVEARKRLEDLVAYVHVHEFDLLERLVADIHSIRLAPDTAKALDLRDYGRTVCGYGGRAQAVAASTGRVQALLNSIAEFYRITD